MLPFRGFRCAPPAVTDSPAPLGPLVLWWPAAWGGDGGGEAGCPLRRDAIHRVSPARGAAPPRHSSLASGHSGGDGHQDGVPPKADIAPQGWPCALYGTLLMRTPTDVCVLALEMRRDGVMASIRPMDCCFHPMDRPIHPLEISLHGHFSIENGPRFAPYSGKKGPHRGVCGRALRVYASASGGSDFRLFASEGALGRKYSILRVKIERCGRFLSSSRAGCGGGHGYFIASEPFGRGRLPPVLRPTGGADASGR